MGMCTLVGLLVVNLTLAAQDGSLHVVVLEGEGAINNIRSPRAKETVVRVEDATNQGVAGAVVTFLLPADGAGAFFGSSGNSLTLTDRKSTRLNSSHLGISYAVFCLKK